LLLEDLSNRGLVEPLAFATWDEMCLVLRWLAHFHAGYLGDPGEGLWACGTYWHLETRPEELANIEGTRLEAFASLLDARLRCGAFPTLVHGDAKLANLLFSEDRERVGAVDFQYVGRGAAMKDVAYFVGSCLSGPDCERLEGEILDVYFSELQAVLPSLCDAQALEAEWRDLYPIAWADFQRFMLGWSPGHQKLTDYSDATTERAMEAIEAELMKAAREACLAAGRFIEANRHRRHEVHSKGFASEAADVVTDIDLEAQAIIEGILAPTLERYDLGWLAEEGEQDESRLNKHAFWAVDPLDGTQHFIDGGAGYATSIALVTRSGRALLGVVYDPVGDALYEAVKGRGVLRNGEPLAAAVEDVRSGDATRWYADRSLLQHPGFEQLSATFDVRFIGGAVMNAIHVLTEPNSLYVKHPKPELGGCAIWDLAAVSLMVGEICGTVRTYDGEALHLNRESSVFFNDVGLVLASADLPADALWRRLRRAAGAGL
jgi:fructose-1,6-bisphosphatase/inositol monophosphatase family enzyme